MSEVGQSMLPYFHLWPRSFYVSFSGEIIGFLQNVTFTTLSHSSQIIYHVTSDSIL